MYLIVIFVFQACGAPHVLTEFPFLKLGRHLESRQNWILQSAKNPSTVFISYIPPRKERPGFVTLSRSSTDTASIVYLNDDMELGDIQPLPSHEIEAILSTTGDMHVLQMTLAIKSFDEPDILSKIAEQLNRPLLHHPDSQKSHQIPPGSWSTFAYDPDTGIDSIKVVGTTESRIIALYNTAKKIASMGHADTKTNLLAMLKDMRKSMRLKGAPSRQLYLAGNITDADLKSFKRLPVVYDTPYLSIDLLTGALSTFYPEYTLRD